MVDQLNIVGVLSMTTMEIVVVMWFMNIPLIVKIVMWSIVSGAIPVVGNNTTFFVNIFNKEYTCHK